jgi:hypothetical protein
MQKAPMAKAQGHAFRLLCRLKCMLESILNGSSRKSLNEVDTTLRLAAAMSLRDHLEYYLQKLLLSTSRIYRLQLTEPGTDRRWKH